MFNYRNISMALLLAAGIAIGNAGMISSAILGLTGVAP